MAREGDEEVFDSPIGWVGRHVRQYVETDSRRGHRWYGMDTLLLTTRGRKTGRLRRTALTYGRDGDHFVVVGSNGGASRHPSWYLNLLDNPTVDVQVGAERFVAHARPATGEERPQLWGLMIGILSEYERYQRRAKRELPVVVLERLSSSQTP